METLQGRKSFEIIISPAGKGFLTETFLLLKTIWRLEKEMLKYNIFVPDTKYRSQ